VLDLGFLWNTKGFHGKINPNQEQKFLHFGKIMKNKKFIQRFLVKAQADEDVLAVLLFGSTARKEEKPSSDVDLCLILEPRRKPYDNSILSHKRLEFMKDFSFDIQIFQQLPVYIRTRVLKDGHVLFVRDEERLYEVALRTAQSFEDFKHIYYDYLKEVETDGS